MLGETKAAAGRFGCMYIPVATYAGALRGMYVPLSRNCGTN